LRTVDLEKIDNTKFLPDGNVWRWTTLSLALYEHVVPFRNLRVRARRRVGSFSAMPMFFASAAS
jgi:hypothetical protein